MKVLRANKHSSNDFLLNSTFFSQYNAFIRFKYEIVRTLVL